MVPKRESEMTASEAADYLGVHPDTVRVWIKEALAAADGQPTHLRKVRAETARKTPRYYVDREEIRALRSRELADL